MADPINLLPVELSRPKRTGPEEIIPVSDEAMPDFGAPEALMADDFWSNLKQFLFERPVKVAEIKGAPFTRAGFGDGIKDNFRYFFSGPKVSNRPIDTRYEVNWGGNFGSFKERLKEFISPSKPAPLPPGIQAVKVKDIWSKDENFGWTQIISFAFHGSVIALLIIPFLGWFSPKISAVNKPATLNTPIDISPYMAKLPAGKDKAGGGGGGGDHSLTPAGKGKAPKFAMTQYAPPTEIYKNPKPQIPVAPTLLGPPDLKIANPNMENFGDPLSKSAELSNGTGGGGGIGSGNGGGIGSGDGGGLGPGSGGGTGGGVFRAGTGGVGSPSCFYMPNPPYSEEARKAKYSGVVLVDAVVTLDGRVTEPRVIKSPGLGLDETTVTTMRTWRCKAALGPNGKPVPTRVQFEVNFRLY